MDALKDTAASLSGSTRSDPLNPGEQPPNSGKGDGALAAASQKGGELLEKGVEFVQQKVLGQQPPPEQAPAPGGAANAKGGGTGGADACAADSTVEDFIRDRYKTAGGSGQGKAGV